MSVPRPPSSRRTEDPNAQPYPAGAGLRPTMPASRRRSGTGAPATAVRRVRSPDDLTNARSLFGEYRQWLATHREITAFADPILATGLRGLDAEIAALPGEYGPPGGCLLVAYLGTCAVGCGALRRQAAGTAEIKRLYLRPGARGRGLGVRLARRLLKEARDRGYRRVVLDTLPTMTEAISLYRRLGFSPAPPYWDHPVPDALFFQRRLELPRTGRGRASPARDRAPEGRGALLRRPRGGKSRKSP